MFRSILLATLTVSTLMITPVKAEENTPYVKITMMLAGLAFVQQHCSDYEMVPSRVNSAFSTLGIDNPTDLPKDVAAMAAFALANLKVDPDSCIQFWNMFGPNGNLVPGILRKKI